RWSLAPGLPLLFPRPRLPQRLLALHASSAGDAAGRLPKQDHRLAWSAHTTSERLGACVFAGAGTDHRAGIHPLPLLEGVLRPGAALVGTLAALLAGPPAVRAPSVRYLAGS